VKAHADFLRHWQQTREQSAGTQSARMLHDACHGILFARTEGEARERLKVLRRMRSMLRSRKWRAVGFLERHWDRLMLYHHVRGLPQTNNMAESFNRQLERRFENHRKLPASLHGDSVHEPPRGVPETQAIHGLPQRRKHLNGRNRLQAAGPKVSSNTWLATSLKHAEFGNR
jgi:hypothetical protein